MNAGVEQWKLLEIINRRRYHLYESVIYLVFRTLENATASHTKTYTYNACNDAKVPFQLFLDFRF